ncbi:phosphonate C-P lyase system protein PhnG [Celerinatantimonas yamalensis]|uniref:Phosphonate C-P lyase system protein PhnG n=1 Tax=Celerinatantimonas yamalensis TaxID=559956 RepID=A0ABW9G840_9GAMM
MEEQISSRQRWLGLLAKASPEWLIEQAESWVNPVAFTLIRPAEIGLAKVQGRMGGTGSTFVLGDITLTRCVVQGPEQQVGMGFVRGRNKGHALCIAKLDALLQLNDYHDGIEQKLLTPLEQQLMQAAKVKQQGQAATQVDFFTLVRGEA